MTTTDQLYEIVEAAVVRPGDTLVVSFGPHVDAYDFERDLARIQEIVGEGVKVLMLGGALRFHVLRPEDAVPQPESGSSAAGSAPPG